VAATAARRVEHALDQLPADTLARDGERDVHPLEIGGIRGLGAIAPMVKLREPDGHAVAIGKFESEVRIGELRG